MLAVVIEIDLFIFGSEPVFQTVSRGPDFRMIGLLHLDCIAGTCEKMPRHRLFPEGERRLSPRLAQGINTRLILLDCEEAFYCHAENGRRKGFIIKTHFPDIAHGGRGISGRRLKQGNYRARRRIAAHTTPYCQIIYQQ